MADEIIKLAEHMFSLAKVQKAATAATDSAARSFSKAANAVDGAGKKWTMFGRVLSGSLVWKLQNYLRSVGQAMDMYYDKSEKMVEAANKQAAGFSELVNQSGELRKQLDYLKDANHEKLMETNVEYQNMFTALEKIEKKEGSNFNAREIALERTKKMYKEIAEQTDKVIKSEGKMLIATMEREKEMAKITAERKEIKENRKEWKEQVKWIKKNKKEWKEQVKWIKKNKKVFAEYSKFKEGYNLPPGTWTAESLASGQEKMKGTLLGKAGKTEEEMDKLLKVQIEEFTAAKRQWRGVKNFFQDVSMLWKSMKRISTKTFKAGVERAGVYLRAAKKGLIIFGKLLFTFTLIAFLVFLLRKAWKKIQKEWPDGAASFMESAKLVLLGLWKTIVYVAEGLYYFGMIFVNWVQLIMALFSGEGDKVNDALSNISKNIGNLAISLLSGLGSLLYGVLIGIIGMLTTWVSSKGVSAMVNAVSGLINNLPEMFVSLLRTMLNEETSAWMAAIGVVLTGVITYALLKTLALALIPVLGPILGPILAIALAVDTIARLITGKGIWGLIKGKEAVAATGANFITSGPTSLLVGDNTGGREHVQVTPLSSPNINGPRGGNVINVHVNGRVGASDSELNDIAKKVGKLISREISRSTSTNARF